MKNMKRALRRHHVARLKAARRFHWGRDLRHDAESLGKAVATPCPCSCWMCGNPSRHAIGYSGDIYGLRHEKSRDVLLENTTSLAAATV